MVGPKNPEMWYVSILVYLRMLREFLYAVRNDNINIR